MFKLKTTILTTTLLLISAVTVNHLYPVKALQPTKVTATKLIDPKDPPCVQMYHCIKKYASEYDIPEEYAFAIAYYESGYQGPAHWKYNHALGKEGGAAGPMQIMPIADIAVNNKHDFHKLNNDIEHNIITSMKILRGLHDRYKDWPIVLGFYNTGIPQVTKYSDLIRTFKTETKWIRC
jgi:soluble lytic murein transglycosylase-like protein